MHKFILIVSLLAAPQGRIGGPGRSEGTIEAGASDIIAATFQAGQSVDVVVTTGNSDDSISCALADSSKKIIDTDVSWSSSCKLHTVAVVQERYFVFIKNGSSRSVHYVVKTN